MAPLLESFKVRPRAKRLQSPPNSGDSVHLLEDISSGGEHSISSKPLLVKKRSLNIASPNSTPRTTTPTTSSSALSSSSNDVSTFSAVFNLTKNIIGSGVLGLPAGLASFGDTPAVVLPGLMLLLLIATMSAYGFSLLGRVCAYTQSHSYREAWIAASGSSSSSWIPTLSCTMVTLLLLVSFSMILSKAVPDLMVYAGLAEAAVAKVPVLLGTTLLVLLPLCLLKDLKSLAPFSIVGIAGMVYTAVVIALRYFQGAYDEAHASAFPQQSTPSSYLADLTDAQLPSFGTQMNLFSTDTFWLIGTLSTSFSAHYNAPRFYWEVSADLDRFHKVVATGFGTSTVVMGCIMVFGFWTFGATCSPLVLDNYAASDTLIAASRFAVTLSLVSSYPLCFAGLRDGVLDLTTSSSADNTDQRLRNQSTIVLLALITGLALTMDDLRLVFTLKGGTFGTATMFIYPSYMMVCYHRKEKKNLEKNKEVDPEQEKLVQNLEQEMPLIIGNGALGFLMGCMGTYRALRENVH